MVPPYSVYLSDYATTGSEKLRVILLQRDLTQSSYQLRLVMSVELNGKIIMRTSHAFRPAPITLSPGLPTTISGAELAPYLDSRNIDFVGYSREQYERTKALPEGNYQIIFTAYDYRRQDIQVSNAGGSFYYLMKGEPPMINFPACGVKIPLRTPQQIIFSWLPRNTASPNSAADTQYELSLYEIRPAGRNPNDIVQTLPPVFTTLTDVTQYVYGPADPMLIENMTYAWRVRAIDKNGKDAFRNNGYSEVCSFTVGIDGVSIGFVKELHAEAETELRGRAWWTKGDFDGYRVNYRKVGEGYEWFTAELTEKDLAKTTASTDAEVKLFDLEADTEYETRVQGKKKEYYGGYSDIVKFRTPPHQIADCGVDAPMPFGDMNNPISFLLPGFIIQIDDMHAILKSVVSLGDGWYSGTGYIFVDFFGMAPFPIKFDRLFIDANRVAGYGKVEYVTRGVVDMIAQQTENAERNNKDRAEQANRNIWADTEFYSQIFVYDVLIDTITVEGVGYLNIKDDAGNITVNAEIIQILVAAPGQAIIIQDKSGDQYVVQRDKNSGKVSVTKVEGGGLPPISRAVGNDDLQIVRKALRKLRSEYGDKLDTYQLPAQRVDHAIAKMILLFSEESSNKEGYKIIASGLKVGDKPMTEYLDGARRRQKTENDQIDSVKHAIAVIVDKTIRKVMLDVDDLKTQLKQAVGSYKSPLGGGPWAGDPFGVALPSCIPNDIEDRAIIKEYLELKDNNILMLKAFDDKLIAAVSSNFYSSNHEQAICNVVVVKAAEYFLSKNLSDQGVPTGECYTRAMDRGMSEIFKTGFKGAFYITTLEIAICLTEKERCVGCSEVGLFSAGLLNGLLQQLDIPEMRDAALELLLSSVKTQWKCVSDAQATIERLSVSKDVREVIKIMTACAYGIEVDIDGVQIQFDAALVFVKENYTDPYLQGKATAFVITIVLPPVVKALQTSKIGQLLKASKSAIINKLRSIDELKGLESVVDDAARGAGKILDAIFDAQKIVVNQNKNIIANASSNAKGAWGEMASDAFLTEKSFQPLHPRKTALTEGWGETGIDGVFKKDGLYYVVEAKYTGSSTLNMTVDGKQLSDTWIRGSGRLEKAVGATLAEEIRVMGYKRVWSRVAPDGTITFKEVDALANEIGDFIP